MACILRAPSDGSCGVLVLTTQERDRQVNLDDRLRGEISGLKGRWLVGLHHNWHDWRFKYDPLFDFSMAGDGDLIEVSGKEVPRIPMDACNFVEETFYRSEGEKFWDILYVARAVNFKRIPEFFNTIRRLYDLGYKYRVLFICPVPPYDPKEEKTVFYRIRESYDRMFTEDEKDLFNLLTIDYRYPFPFDLHTLAHFYRSAKIFVHTADDERRCRVAAYAWASGLPVVGMECVAGLLPKQARCEPYIFQPKSYREFPAQIIKALSSRSSMNWNQALMREAFCEVCTPDILDKWLEQIAASHGRPYETGHLSRTNLSIRLGRHHTGQLGPNSLKPTLPEFIKRISAFESQLSAHLTVDDPERSIQAEMRQTGAVGVLGKIFSRR